MNIYRKFYLQSLDKNRLEFKKLSMSFVYFSSYIKDYQNTIYIQHCPMADNNKGADWLSLNKAIKNPYFGDKMSPLSETTNLAPSVSGTNLIDHIKYMTHTTLPSILITLIIFFVIGLCSTQKNIELGEIDVLMKSIESYFYIGTELFILPFIIIILVYKKFSAIKTLLIGVLTGVVFAYIFQKGLIILNIYTFVQSSVS